MQLEYPALDLGPNDGSLCEEQDRILKSIPVTIKDFNGFSRDEEWRPLHSDECIKPSKPYKNGMDYFNLGDINEKSKIVIAVFTGSTLVNGTVTG